MSGSTIVSPGRKASRRRRGVPRYGAMAEINMTPFIDVMLVLLIIFMVAAPLLTSGIPIDLPQTQSSALNIEAKPVSISVDEQGKIYLMDQPVMVDELIPRLQTLAPQGLESRLYIRGSKAVNYGRIAEIMALMTTAGYKKIALITETDRP